MLDEIKTDIISADKIEGMRLVGIPQGAEQGA